MNQITPIHDDDPFEWPPYSEKGDIIVEITGFDDKGQPIVGESSCGCGSTTYVTEGMGVSYWVELYWDDKVITKPGVYTFVGVHGYYFRGEYGVSDDDEEWYFDECRPATDEEIEYVR